MWYNSVMNRWSHGTVKLHNTTLLLHKCSFKLMPMLEWLMLFFLTVLQTIFCVNFVQFLHQHMSITPNAVTSCKHCTTYPYSITLLHYYTIYCRKYPIHHLSTSWYLHGVIASYTNYTTYPSHQTSIASCDH